MRIESDIPWKRLMAEGAAIVVSILLAFSIDAWWDNRQERVQEQEYLEALFSEVENLLGAIDRTVAGNSEENEKAKGRIEELRRGPVPSSKLSQKIWGEWGWVYGVDETLDTYTELLSAGGVTILRDPDVRRSLAHLRRRMEMESQAWTWTAELGIQWQPMVFEALKAGDAESLIAMEELLVSWREWHNGEKVTLREAAIGAHDAIAAAMDSG